jgi:DNA polymerase III subunit chi
VAEVVFLTGVVDVVDFAVRLLRKKYREGTRTAVYAHPALLQRLDQALWVGEQLDFTPHMWLRGASALPSATVQARTPLWLLTRPQAQLACETGVNLGCDGLDLGGAHARVAEVIGTEPDGMAAGRARWKAYEAGGHTLVHKPQRG